MSGSKIEELDIVRSSMSLCKKPCQRCEAQELAGDTITKGKKCSERLPFSDERNLLRAHPPPPSPSGRWMPFSRNAASSVSLSYSARSSALRQPWYLDVQT